MLFSKDEMITRLGLVPHTSEGGYYRQYHVSGTFVVPQEDPQRLRVSMDTIFYMLTDDQPIGKLHRNRSDIVHFYQAGSPLRYTTLADDGQVESTIVGPDLGRGQVLQFAVRGGIWKATELTRGSYGLVGEAVSPGFDPSDRDFMTAALLRDRFPAAFDRLARFLA